MSNLEGTFASSLVSSRRIWTCLVVWDIGKRSWRLSEASCGLFRASRKRSGTHFKASCGLLGASWEAIGRSWFWRCFDNHDLAILSLGDILNLHVASLEPPEYLLEGLGNVLGGPKYFLEAAWGSWSCNFAPRSWIQVILFFRHFWRGHFGLMLYSKIAILLRTLLKTEFATIAKVIRKAYAKACFYSMFDVPFWSIWNAKVGTLFSRSFKNNTVHVFEVVIEH